MARPVLHLHGETNMQGQKLTVSELALIVLILPTLAWTLVGPLEETAMSQSVLMTRMGVPDVSESQRQKKPGRPAGTKGRSDIHMGTWKLNEAKSKIAPGVAKNSTVVVEDAGDNIKVTVDGTDSDGKPVHNEWTGKFDGKDYPVTGDPTSDMRSYKQVDDKTLDLTVKKDGKVIVTGKIVMSADGKMRSVTTNGTDAQGKKFKSAAVYDKQ
jgi:hypothetical protein